MAVGKQGASRRNSNGILNRWVIRCRDRTLRYFYRAMMEAQLGRELRPDEIVHHIDGDPTNDYP